MDLAKKPVAFVIMPFADEFTDIFEDLIRSGLDADYEVVRADSHLDERNILAKIIRGIDDADLVIVDLTTFNANVMYELGVAHAFGKPTIMITQTLAGLPFDVRSYPAHLYSTYFKRAPELSARLREIGERQRDGLLEFANPVIDFRAPESERERRTTPPSPTDIARRVSADGEPTLSLAEAAIEFKQIFDLLASETTLFSAHLTQSTTELNYARESKFASERVPAIKNATAAHISAYGKAIRAQQPRLHETWRRFGEGMLREVAHVKSGAEDLPSAVASVAMLDSELTATFEHIFASVRPSLT